MTEAELTHQLLAAAQDLGYRCIHQRPALTSRGWRTAVQGREAAGWPDVVLAKPGRLIFAEVKQDGKKLRPEQQSWLDLLATVPGCAAFCWRPADWHSGAIVQELLKGAAISRFVSRTETA